MAANAIDADWTVSTFNTDDDIEKRARVSTGFKNQKKIKLLDYADLSEAFTALVDRAMVGYYQYLLAESDYSVLRHLEETNRAVSTTLDATKYDKLCENRDTWRAYIVTYNG